jgi:plastocyanin
MRNAPVTLTLLVAAMVFMAPAGADAAAIRGVVQLAGARPEPRKVPVTIDQYVCGTDKVAEDLVVGRDRGIRNVVVWLDAPPAGTAKRDAPAAAAVEVDQKACVFVPRVAIVPAGGTVNFLNSDRLLHNLHTKTNENGSFNRTQPKGRTIPVVLHRPEIVKIDCDLHSWMRAWIVVADHPFYALTSDSGEFTLPPVPAGKYVLRVWHETLGTTTREITVGDQDARVTIELKARP